MARRAPAYPRVVRPAPALPRTVRPDPEPRPAGQPTVPHVLLLAQVPRVQALVLPALASVQAVPEPLGNDPAVAVADSDPVAAAHFDRVAPAEGPMVGATATDAARTTRPRRPPAASLPHPRRPDPSPSRIR
jgi:hypothetical protein